MRALVLVMSWLCLAPVFAGETWFIPYDPDEHTIALFHLDEGADQQANAAQADITATFAEGAGHIEGVFGGGVRLRGPKECLKLSANEALSLGNAQPFTVEAWVRPDGGEGSIFSIGTRFYLSAHFSRGTANFGYRAASFPIRWFAMSAIPWRPRQWQHLALTHDADRVVRIYLNGVEVARASHADEGDYQKSGGSVFGAHDGWTRFLVGAMDEIRVSNTVRSFQPLLTQRAYLPGEQVQLNLADVPLPAYVATARVMVTTAGGEQAFAAEIPVARAAEPLFDAEQLGAGPARLTVAFLDAEGKVVSSVERPVSFAGAALSELKARTAACRALLEQAGDAAPPQAEIARRHLKAAERMMEARSFDSAASYLGSAEWAAAALGSGEAGYRTRIRSHVREGDRDDRLRVTMSWDANEAAKDAFPWAERLGANELVTSSRSATPEGMKAWQEAGYHTAMLSGVPIHAAEKESPDHLQFGYWLMDTPPAEDDTVSLKLVTPTWGGLSVSTHFAPKDHWLVLDNASGEELAPERWEYDAETRQLTVTGAEAGHSYRVYFMIQTGHIGDPLYEPFARHGLTKLDELIAPLEGVLETYWYDDLAYAWPGLTPQHATDWESYTTAARPENQQAFTAATGLPFDPRWLVMPPKTLNVPPRPEYFAWMGWVQEGIKTWMQRATKVCHDRGMRTWLYWGDCHVGIEPFLGSLTAGSVDEVDKPAGDPVTARALVDFPGDVYRRMRVEWLHGHVIARIHAARIYAERWDRSKRGLLMSPPQGIYWMPFPKVTDLSDEAVREDLVEKLAQINDEFRLIARHLSGHRAYESDLDLYVVHSWGKQYSWRSWGDPILWNLTDLPLRVHFISFREVVADGIPDDADALFLYGMPNTAWSGGYVWEDERLAGAISDFVRAGGGLVGLQAPSHTDLPEPRWALAEVFGVTAEGTEGYEAQPIGPEELAAEALGAAADEDGLSLVATAGRGAQALRWEAAELHIPGMVGTVRVATISEDVTVAYALEGEEGGFSPGVTFRQAGEGRAVHVCGYSRDYAFYRLLRAAIYWAANREAEARQLEVEGGENLFVYAYPDLSIIALLSTDDEPAQATIRCAPTVLGLPADAACQISDLVTEEELSAAANLAQGLTVTTVPHCVRLLQVRGAQ